MEQVNTVDDYLEKISRYNIYDNVFYRGQLEEYQNITSSVSRNKGYTINEHLIYKEAIRMKSVEFPDLVLPINCLSKMQHYGIPTRLVDLTIDPLTALFFAVQKVDSESPGNVYVFVQPEHSLDDKRIKLLSLLATLESLELSAIKNAYQEYYSETITKDEILEYASEGSFVKHSVELAKYNERLFCQKGTFAICGNEISGKDIKKSVLPLDSIKPTMVIRIPFEYKQAIKKELDERHRINETTIYPELPSVADYLKEKYKKVDLNLDGTYNILEVQDVSYAAVKRCSVVVVLNKALRIQEVKQIGEKIIDQYKGKSDVIWVYIAKNGDDYIMQNWIITGQWIRESLDSKFKPLVVGEADKQGYIWHHGEAYSTLSDYYDEYVFVDDKILFTQNMKTFEKLVPHYKYMLNAFKSEDMEDLENYANENASAIKDFFLKFGEYGHSRNDEFNKYLSSFQEAASHLDNVALWLKNAELNSTAKRYQISKCFQEAKLHFDEIQEKSLYWKKTINLSDDEYNKIDPEKIERKEYQYTPTIPLNPNSLDVVFDLDISKNSDNTINIKGTTNLFDNASLMISLSDLNGLLLAQNRALTKNGEFDFGILGKKDIGFKKGTYSVNITLSIPSVQNNEFVHKAGIEYENLKGPHVDRTGIGPTVSYTEEFEI
jgi:hypothetical protein